MNRLYVGILTILDDELSLLIVTAIAVIFGLGLVLGIFARFTTNLISARSAKFVSFVPNAMTTLGVIGTFVGIFVGLIDFDVENIDASVPNLLQGLKIAFGTSISGMLASITFRGIEHSGRLIFGSKPIGSSEVNPIEVLSEINNSINNLNNSIIGDNDSSLLSTIKLARQDTNDGFKRQIKAFEDFSEQMKDGATSILIESLKSVIDDFNKKITEQFDDNFKQLNSAVGNLNKWQQEYKNQIVQTQQALKIQSDTMEGISGSFMGIQADLTSLATQAEKLPIAADKMKESNDAILQNFGSMAELLESFAGIKSQAETVIPEIEQSLKSLTHTLESSAEELGVQIKDALEQAHKGINANFNTFDEQMQQELGRVLETMGTNLTSLSNKFVEDYTPLTEKLRQLVRETSGAAQ